MTKTSYIPFYSVNNICQPIITWRGLPSVQNKSRSFKHILHSIRKQANKADFLTIIQIRKDLLKSFISNIKSYTTREVTEICNTTLTKWQYLINLFWHYTKIIIQKGYMKNILNSVLSHCQPHDLHTTNQFKFVLRNKLWFQNLSSHQNHYQI
jgi:hypothetical protein